MNAPAETATRRRTTAPHVLRPSDVADCTEVIERYRKNRSEEAMEQLARAVRVRPADFAAGIDDCWRTLQTRAPGMLIVEDSFVSPASGQMSRLGPAEATPERCMTVSTT